jgi:hypothetical protein
MVDADEVVLPDGEVVLPVLCAITGMAQAAPSVMTAATCESFFIRTTPWVSMNP